MLRRELESEKDRIERLGEHGRLDVCGRGFRRMEKTLSQVQRMDKERSIVEQVVKKVEMVRICWLGLACRLTGY
jgi:hypothetical protein